MDQTGRGNIVDRPWNAAGIIVDQGFCIGCHQSVCCAGTFESVVNIGSGLVSGQRFDVVSHIDSVDQVGQTCTLELNWFPGR
jgi:hypothetical protein